MRRLLLRLAIPLVLLLIVLEVLPVYGRATADSRISSSLKAALAKHARYYSVTVDFDFHPETFNLQKLQNIGTLAGVGGTTVKVLDLTAAQIREIAGFYWVKQISPLNGAG